MQKKPTTVIGWDIGGAHVKAACVKAGRVYQVQQIACPLWQGLDQLKKAVQAITQSFQLDAASTDIHAITMTGELVDLFPNRKAGVEQIAQVMQNELNADCWYYQCDKQYQAFIPFESLSQQWRTVASANWHASAQLLASTIPAGVLLDIGSTTTDIILLHDHQVKTIATDDAGRMKTGELVYTGVVRTPLMALGPNIEWQNQVQAVAAEYFATTADIYRLTGQLDVASDMAGAADGGEKTSEATCRRLARMVGHDAEELAEADWLKLAQAFKAKQLDLIVAATERQLDRLIAFDPQLKSITIITAGVGAFLAKEVIAQIAQTGHYPTMHLQQSVTVLEQSSQQMVANTTVPLQQWTSHCLPAVAVALLADDLLAQDNA